MGKGRTQIKGKKTNRLLVILTLIFLIISLINFAFVTSLTYLTPILLGINLLLMLIWIVKWNKKFIIPLVAAISQLFFIPSLYCLNSANKSNSGNILKVSSYNVNYFSYNHCNNVNDIVSILEKEEVNIACFQEFVEHQGMNKEDFWNSFRHLPHCSVQERKEANTPRLAIYSEYPIVNEQKELFLNGINSGMYVDLEIHGNIVRVINCHLQTTGVNSNKKYGASRVFEVLKINSHIRKEQIELISSIIMDSKYPVILCGDFNDTPLSYTYRLIARKLSDGYKKAGSGNSCTFIGGFKNLLRIDYIFSSREFKCTDYKSVEYIFSDHKAVISTLEYKN